MFEDGEEYAVVNGPPEAWAEFADRCQRQLGKGARVFIGQQVGTEQRAEPVMFIVLPGPWRKDLLNEAVALLAQATGAKEAE